MDINQFIESNNLDSAFGFYLHQNKEALSSKLQAEFDSAVKENGLSKDSTIKVSQFENIFAKMQIEGIKLTLKIVTDVLSEYLSQKNIEDDLQ